MVRLRLNQSVAAVFYLPHYVALELGTFRDEGLTIELVTSSFGQQWPLLEQGKVDLTIGGGIRTMELQARENKRLVSFCAALRANPWYLIARRPEPDFTWARLVGRTVIDFGDAAPPRLCLRWVLQRQGIDLDKVSVLTGLGTARELEAFRSGQGDYLLHSLSTTAALIAAGEAVPVQELATPTGPVPWSTYFALPETLRTRRADLEAFTRAVALALRWIAEQPAIEIAALVTRYFPGFAADILADVIARYQPLGIWPRDPLIPRADFEHFRSILLATGWLPRPVPYEDQVDTSFATKAIAALG